MEALLGSVVTGLLLGLALGVLLAKALSRDTVFDYERGLFYRNGRFVSVLEAGSYWFLSRRSLIRKVDLRVKTVTIGAQEVLTADSIGIRVTLAFSYAVVDPVSALTKVEDYAQALHVALQLALRQVMGEVKAEEITARRQEIGAGLIRLARDQATQLGLRLDAADIKDIMYPGEMKSVLGQVVKAQKEGQAILERARGETAALRNLANAAKMIETNPQLMQLRLLQMLESGGGNTVVLGVKDGGVPLPIPKTPVKKSTRRKRKSPDA